MHGFFQCLRENSTPIPDSFLSLEKRIALALQAIPKVTRVDTRRFEPDKAFLLTKEIPDPEKGVRIFFLDLPVPLKEEDDERVYGPYIKNGWAPFIEGDQRPSAYPWDFQNPLESLKRVYQDYLRPDACEIAESLLRREIYQHMPYAGEPPS